MLKRGTTNKLKGKKTENLGVDTEAKDGEHKDRKTGRRQKS
jgi:hypothetical protein